MSGPPQGHLCGKTLLHTRGFGLKILQPNQQNGAQQTSTNIIISTPVNTNFDETTTKPTTTTSKS